VIIKYSISTKQSAYQNIFYLASIFRSKEICPSYKQLAPPPGGGVTLHSLKTFELSSGPQPQIIIFSLTINRFQRLWELRFSSAAYKHDADRFRKFASRLSVYLNDYENNTMSASQLVDIYDVTVRKEADLARTTAEHRQTKIKMNVLFGTSCVLRFLRFLINSGCT
jgi:hypothetical protein